MRQQEPFSRLLDQICALLFSALRFHKNAAPSVRDRLPPLTPGGFASLMLGISISLMLCGSITFMIGFMMMPWVIGMIMVLYFVGILSSIFLMWKVVIGIAFSSAPSNSSQKRMSGAFL